MPDARLYFAKDTYDELPHDSMRQTIAKRLTTSKRDIPHYYLKIDCNIDTLLDVRKQMNEKAPAEGAGAYKLSVNDFIVKAAALALIRVPGVNSSWTETALLRHKHADVGVAVALDFGLITPIVFKAETKSLAAISREVKDLAVRAKAKKLKPAEFEGGTFCDLEPRHVRHSRLHGGDQPAARGDPGGRRGRTARGGQEGRARRRQRDDGANVVRPPRHRRRPRRDLARGVQGLHRRPGDDVGVNFPGARASRPLYAKEKERAGRPRSQGCYGLQYTQILFPVGSRR